MPFDDTVIVALRSFNETLPSVIVNFSPSSDFSACNQLSVNANPQSEASVITSAALVNPTLAPMVKDSGTTAKYGSSGKTIRNDILPLTSLLIFVIAILP